MMLVLRMAIIIIMIMIVFITITTVIRMLVKMMTIILILVVVHPVRIARIRLPRFVPRVGLPRNLCLIGNLTAALRCCKGWVRKGANLGL